MPVNVLNINTLTANVIHTPLPTLVPVVKLKTEERCQCHLRRSESVASNNIRSGQAHPFSQLSDVGQHVSCFRAVY